MTQHRFRAPKWSAVSHRCCGSSAGSREAPRSWNWSGNPVSPGPQCTGCCPRSPPRGSWTRTRHGQVGAGTRDPADGLGGVGAFPDGGHRPAQPAPAGRGNGRERLLLYPPRRRNRVPAPGGGQLPGAVLRAARGSPVPAGCGLRGHGHHGVPARGGAGRAAGRLVRPRRRLCGGAHRGGPGQSGDDPAGRLFGESRGWCWKAAGGWGPRSSTSADARPGRCP